ncbi:peptidoglycan-binding protein [Streptomyces sp. NPDC002039]|uniref:peptidoglycan-binding domain-containing protein n=1 Tax=Streptomyces sp. NPDC002039 TaxID=3154660 RepID=UPI00332621D8
MSHHTDESAIVPDDHLLVRPYVAPSGRPSRAAGPARPRTEPATDPRAHSGDESASGHTPAWYGQDPAPGVPYAPAPGPGPVVAPAPVPVARERTGWLPAAALALLGLAVAGGLVYLTAGPEPESPRVAPPSGLSVPVLPARSPDAGPDAGGAESSASPAAPPSSASASSAAGRGAEGPSTSPGRGSTPTTAPSPSRPPATTPGDGASATLRPGDRGPEVRALQERLHGQGFTYVSTTGVYDEQTRRGVVQLQSDRSITGDPRGVYGPATRAAFD